MKMFKKVIISGAIIGLLSVMLVCEIVLAAQEQEVLTGITTGQRKIINHNIQYAKQKAVSDALEIAVQNAFAALVSRQAVAANLDFFYDQIVSNTENFIITYRVLGGMEHNNKYLAGVESKVNLTLLKQKLIDARILSTGTGKPVVVLFLVEKMPSDILSRYWWGQNPIPYESYAEKIISDKLKKERFVITGSGATRPDPSFYDITFDSIYDIQAAKELGEKMKADMIIFGKATAQEAINRMGEDKTFDARITLSAYELETSQKVIELTTQAAATSEVDAEGSVLALSRAAGQSADELVEQLDEYWLKKLRKEQVFDVSIKGENFLSRFIALKGKLKQIPEIENMQPKEMGSDYAVMEVFFKGNSSQFADMIVLKTFDKFGIEILEVRDNFVDIRFIEKDVPYSSQDSVEEDKIQGSDITQ